jgi:hypothetical protein
MSYEDYGCDGPDTETWEDVDGNECTMDACTRSPERFYDGDLCDTCPRLAPL